MSKITDLTALSVPPASGDLFPVVDVSDTTDSADGTTKSIAASVIGLDVKKYVAILTQTSTNAPTATVLENTLGGTPVWSYTDVGDYLMTLSSAFPTSKTVVFFDPNAGAGQTQTNWFEVYVASSSTIRLYCAKISDDSAVNDVLVASSIMVIVYP